MQRILIFLLLVGCTASSKRLHTDDEVYAVQARRILPVHGEKAKLQGYDTSISFVYFRGDARIYDFTWKNYISEDGKLVKTETRHRFVLVQGKDRYGFEFNSNVTPQKRRVSIDSLFRDEWIYSTGDLMAGKTDLISSYKDIKTGILRETYRITNETDTNYKSTGELLFSDSLPWLQLPYNEEINSKRKMQLIRTTLKSESQFYKPIKEVLEGFTATFEFTKIPANEDLWNRLLKYFKD